MNNNLKVIDYVDFFDSYFMKKISFVLDGREIKNGKLKLFNTKEFNLRFDLVDSNGEIKIFEIPFPFSIKKLDKGCQLDYTIDAITALDDLKLLDYWESSPSIKSRFYNKILEIKLV